MRSFVDPSADPDVLEMVEARISAMDVPDISHKLSGFPDALLKESEAILCAQIAVIRMVRKHRATTPPAKG